MTASINLSCRFMLFLKQSICDKTNERMFVFDSDLEKSVEEIQKEMSVNHRHLTVQELEEKSSLLRKLGETLTELKSETDSNSLLSFTARHLNLSYRRELFTSLPVCFSLCLSRSDQFPGLQSKMRVVLRVEVEAVKFLKEEPHRLDALLKRCRSITDTLSTLRR